MDITKTRRSFPNPVEQLKRQIICCPNSTATIRGAVSTLRNTRRVFILFESKKENGEELMTNQITTNFEDAEKLFLWILSVMVKNGWSYNPSESKAFIDFMNKTIHEISDHDGIMLPTVTFLHQ